MSNAQFFNNDSRLILHFLPVIQLTNDQFFHFCQINREFQIERTCEGDIIVMVPTGGGTSSRNSDLITMLNNWAKRDKTGIVFDSSGGFVLPNGATRSPDASWVKRSRLISLSPTQKEKFLPLCPDFVVELRSPSDSLTPLQDKMQEYLDNGAQLGWLIDPVSKRVYIYRPDKKVECVEQPSCISGESILSDFVLDLEEIWTATF